MSLGSIPARLPIRPSTTTRGSLLPLEPIPRILIAGDAPGFADEVIHIYVAKNLKKLDVPVALDEDEFVELMAVTVEEAEVMMADARIYDAKTAFAILWMKCQK